MRSVNCTIRLNGNIAPVGTPVDARLDADNDTIAYPGQVEEPGRLIFHLPDGHPYGGAWIDVRLDGYEGVSDRVVLPLENATEGPEIRLVSKPLQKIHIQGQHFYTADGQPWIWKGASDFSLYKHYLEGRDITPLLRERRFAGANLVRVFGLIAWDNWKLDPHDHPGYYANIPGFAALLAQHGLYMEYVVFTARKFFPNLDTQAHYAQCCDALRQCPNVFVELCNEFKKNGIDPLQFTKPTGLIASAGSGLSDSSPGIYWDFFGWHGRRDWPKLPFVDDMHTIAKRENIVGVHDEPIGAHEIDIPGRRTTSALAMQSIASEGVRLGAGATFHSEAGLRSDHWGNVQYRLAHVFFAAMDVV